ncbi:Phospholipid scramblase 1 [Papilio machaon]|uniref:Phospholipid scramblase n=1 Tax=Papilio machaon TaxID=76193 RepID=A0A0N1I8D5_PAPMA|nr:Phospholipid scramblase 1 [Papilio machaon]
MGPDKMEVCVCGRGVALVRKEFTFLKPIINVNDAADRPLFRVKGPLALTSQCDFEIYNMEKKRVGAIRKKWGGLGREAFSSADNYIIELPADLDVRYKAALLGTCFLIVRHIFTRAKPTFPLGFNQLNKEVVRDVSSEQAGRRAGGQAGRRAGGQAGRRAGGQASGRAGGQAGRRTGGQASGRVVVVCVTL